MVITYNEEDWIEPSILSIKDLVDEYIVMDSSTDKTPEIVERVKSEHGLNIKLRRIPPGNICSY
jgi:glycosyltransferase involved in cell wall biosynthesis